MSLPNASDFQDDGNLIKNFLLHIGHLSPLWKFSSAAFVGQNSMLCRTLGIQKSTFALYQVIVFFYSDPTKKTDHHF